MNSAFKNDTELFKTISKSRHLIFTNNMSSTENKQLTWGHLWLAEAWRFECDADDLTTVECAELADELWHHKVMADEDLNFFGELLEWTDYIYERDLLLPLEQSCHEGMLLPVDQRAGSSLTTRIRSANGVLKPNTRGFTERDPPHYVGEQSVAFREETRRCAFSQSPTDSMQRSHLISHRTTMPGRFIGRLSHIGSGSLAW